MLSNNRFIKRIFIDKTIIFELSLYALSFISLVNFIIQGNTAKAFKCLLMASLLLAYRFLPKLFSLQLNNVIKFSLLIFIFMAIFLAEILNFYKRISFYDKILHSLSGVLFFFVGQGLFRCIDKKGGRDKENPLMMALFSLFFSLSIAGCWEIFEFSMDRLFGYHLQLDSLFDTMTDIICATITATITTVLTIAVHNKTEVVNENEAIGEPADESKDYSLGIPAKHLPL